jgi:hypothetical protein
MSAHFTVSHLSRTALAASLVLTFPLAGVAQNPVSEETLSIAIFSDRYIVAGRQFSGLKALQRGLNPSNLRLDGCDQASAARLLAMVERFQHAYLEIGVLGAGDPRCAAAAAAHPNRASDATMQVPASERNQAVDPYWRSVMP